jgi:hypothetical protein
MYVRKEKWRIRGKERERERIRERMRERVRERTVTTILLEFDH